MIDRKSNANHISYYTSSPRVLHELLDPILKLFLCKRCQFKAHSMPKALNSLSIVILISENGHDNKWDAVEHGFMNTPQPSVRDKTFAMKATQNGLLWHPPSGKNVRRHGIRHFSFVLPNELDRRVSKGMEKYFLESNVQLGYLDCKKRSSI